MRSKRKLEETLPGEKKSFDASTAKRVRVAAQYRETITTSVKLTYICVLGVSLQCVMYASEPCQKNLSPDTTKLETLTWPAIARGATTVWSVKHAENRNDRSVRLAPSQAVSTSVLNANRYNANDAPIHSRGVTSHLEW